MTWLQRFLSALAGKAHTKEDVDKASASRQSESCGCQPTNGAMHHGVLLRRMQTAVPPGIVHGPSQALGHRVRRRNVDSRTTTDDHIYDGIQKAIAGMDVLLVGPQATTAETQCGRMSCVKVGVISYLRFVIKLHESKKFA